VPIDDKYVASAIGGLALLRIYTTIHVARNAGTKCASVLVMKSNLAQTCLILTLLCGCSAAPPITKTGGKAVVVPSDWVTVDSTCGFTFQAPADLVRKNVQAIDSCVGQHESKTTTMSYDYGGYSSPLTEFASAPNYSESVVAIDGASGKLIACDEGNDRFIGVYVADDGRGAKLQASVRCSTEACEDTARTILSTITWKH
jgi:hypothetical protein